MPTETNNWRAFNLATDALRDIDHFISSRTKSRETLLAAKQKLEAAVTKDPAFLWAQYYTAIVDDLLGQSEKAAGMLERLLLAQPAFKNEAEYNLGVSYYHQYHREPMVKAISTFEKVVEQTADDAALQYLARAGLVRALAMMVLHS